MMANHEDNSPRSPRTAIIGVGNHAGGDDAAGLLVLDALRRMERPPDVDLIDAGLAGLALVSYMEGYARVVLVDAVDMGLAPGEVRTFRPADVRSARDAPPLSLHACDLLEVIELSGRIDMCPDEVIVVGIQPKAVLPAPGICKEVQESVFAAAKQALAAAVSRGPGHACGLP